MGARGNSGVILSQFFRGLAKGLQEQEEANSLQFAKALQLGVKAAYKAVMKPVEGTILTVAREAVAGALAAAETTESLSAVLDALLGHGEEALIHTPDLLPVLKRAGVVDAGGKGYMLIWSGARLALQRLENGGSPLPAPIKDPEKDPASKLRESDGSTSVNISNPLSLALDEATQLQYQYCTEAIVKGSGLPLEQLRRELAGLGDSMLVVGTEKLVKVHIHTNHPGLVLETCLQYGSLHQLKIDNMQEQHREFSEPKPVVEVLPQTILPNASPKQIGLITVAAGAGLVEILESLGVDQVVLGGQSMNPSIEDLVQAVNLIEASQVIILPNNPNIILAAEQVAAMCDKEVRVIARPGSRGADHRGFGGF